MISPKMYNYAPTSGDKQQAFYKALMALGGQLAAGSAPTTDISARGRAYGQAGPAFAQSYQGSLDQGRKDKIAELQGQRMQVQDQRAVTEASQQAELFGQKKTTFGDQQTDRTRALGLQEIADAKGVRDATTQATWLARYYPGVPAAVAMEEHKQKVKRFAPVRPQRPVSAGMYDGIPLVIKDGVTLNALTMQPLAMSEGQQAAVAPPAVQQPTPVLNTVQRQQAAVVPPAAQQQVQTPVTPAGGAQQPQPLVAQQQRLPTKPRIPLTPAPPMPKQKQVLNPKTGLPQNVPLTIEQESAAKLSAMTTTMRQKVRLSAEKALPDVKAEAARMIGLLKKIRDNEYLDDYIGLPENAGRDVGRTISSGFASLGFPIPTTKAHVLKGLIDNALDESFMTAFKSLKGGGQITEREGDAAKSAQSRVGQVNLEIGEYKKAIGDFIKRIQVRVGLVQREAGVGDAPVTGRVDQYGEDVGELVPFGG